VRLPNVLDGKPVAEARGGLGVCFPIAVSTTRVGPLAKNCSGGRSFVQSMLAISRRRLAPVALVGLDELDEAANPVVSAALVAATCIKKVRRVGIGRWL